MYRTYETPRVTNFTILTVEEAAVGHGTEEIALLKPSLSSDKILSRNKQQHTNCPAIFI